MLRLVQETDRMAISTLGLLIVQLLNCVISAKSTKIMGLHSLGDGAPVVSRPCRQLGLWLDSQLGVVLKAIRHQRKEHNESQASPSHSSCAQRLSASTEGTHEPLLTQRHVGNLCSTPFGINGRTTFVSRHENRGRSRVLNAFRHQRKEHRVLVAVLDVFGLCATPFGINGRNTTATEAR